MGSLCICSYRFFAELSPKHIVLLLYFYRVTSIRRWQSKVAGNVDTYFLTARTKETFVKNWLSDPSTYPMIVIMGCAASLVVGAGASYLIFSPDVQLSIEKRNSILRYWGLPKGSGD
jgi:hypothetical protein